MACRSDTRPPSPHLERLARLLDRELWRDGEAWGAGCGGRVCWGGGKEYQMKNQSWDDYERAAEHGPWRFFWKAAIALMVAGVPLGLWAHGCSLANEAATVAREEFGPRELLRKYEWFKDAAAQLEKKQADMGVYDSRLSALSGSYTGKSRAEWARDDREQWSIWQSEAAGVRASYNTLAAEYNAQMAKFNWRFTNAGQLPDGASEPLPRAFKPYEEK